jgi:hypothetical protein
LLAAAEDYQQLYEASQRENHELASVLINQRYQSKEHGNIGIREEKPRVGGQQCPLA